MATIRTQPKADEPPYTRYAFLSKGNLAALAGATVASAATGEPWIAVCAAAAEAVWLLLAPQSDFLRRRWFDPTWTAKREAEDEARLLGKLDGLAPPDQIRACALIQQRARIEALARENPSFASTLVDAELSRLGGLVEGFVDLGLAVARADRHLGSFDIPGMQRAWNGYVAQMKELPERDPRRAIAAKNLEVLKQRTERHADLGRSVGTARGQMDLIENTFRLLADEIVTMVSPAELGRRLDDLRIAVDAIRETVRESDAVEEDAEDATTRGPRRHA
jgi:hypothetical protein